MNDIPAVKIKMMKGSIRCLVFGLLGLLPVIGLPFALAAIGPRAARRYFVTGERIDAETALRPGRPRRPALESEARPGGFGRLALELNTEATRSVLPKQNQNPRNPQ